MKARPWLSDPVERDEETSRLISDLLVRAGMLMEDFSPECVSSPSTLAERQRQAQQTGLAGIAIGALTIAAWALSRASERSQ